MQKGDKIYTPRFCTVTINEIFDSAEEAEKQGYTEPTHYQDDNYTIRGKSIGINRMVFAGIKKE